MSIQGTPPPVADLRPARLRTLGHLHPAVQPALERVPIPMYVADRDGVVRWQNAAAVELLGDVAGRSFVHAVAPESVNEAKRVFATTLLGSSDGTKLETKLLARDGRRLAVDLTTVPLRNKTEVIGVLAIAQPRPGTAGRPRTEAPELSPRKHEVLSLLAEGRSTDEISSKLGIAPETTRNHVRGLLAHLGVGTRLEAVVLAFRNGWL